MPKLLQILDITPCDLKIFHWALLKNTISKNLSYYCIGSCPYFIEKTLIFRKAETSLLIQLKQ